MRVNERSVKVPVVRNIEKVRERQIINQLLENQVKGNTEKRENQDKDLCEQATPRKCEKKLT